MNTDETNDFISQRLEIDRLFERVQELESFIRRLSPEGNAMGVLSEAKKILGE